MSEQQPTTEDVEPFRAVVVTGTGVPVEDLRDFFDSGFQRLGAALQAQGGPPAGPAFAAYDRQPSETVDLRIGFPVGPAVVAAEGVEVIDVPGGRVARLVHEGGYDDLSGSWDRLVTWALEQGERPAGWFYEEYLTEPTPDADPADMRTRLTLPLQPA
ncbi:hypothetical protein SGUI_1387 [Serinicoccus hydrothermalis]|uniref:AraC effector-binding domain-containing protein n=1 Tax=Serinicoccus hydrothermalis TaxID=1758689 RepID=A0A1B1NBI4_9MICO|nr:GyrI-like domain-containing protein [Serinicoccus hydrothermalis]ANS78783.1 hypothetical protein SGUI_1387 [Serinicoccus hydrothermalis]